MHRMSPQLRGVGARGLAPRAHTAVWECSLTDAFRLPSPRSTAAELRAASLPGRTHTAGGLAVAVADGAAAAVGRAARAALPRIARAVAAEAVTRAVERVLSDVAARRDTAGGRLTPVCGLAAGHAGLVCPTGARGSGGHVRAGAALLAAPSGVEGHGPVAEDLGVLGLHYGVELLLDELEVVE